MEERSLEQNQARIKFSLEYLGVLDLNCIPTKDLEELSSSLVQLEEDGAAPVLPDGKVGGNAALLFSDNQIFVSKSGKKQGECLQVNEFCLVNEFNRNDWKGKYYSCESSLKPSSDTPLLWNSLIEASTKYNWKETPKIAFHGHALADENSAKHLNLPISPEETLFSTPEDLQALENLFQQYPYPQNKIFIRRGHGFFLLASSIHEAMTIYSEQIQPFIKN